ncbi:MAG: adhesin [Luteimonas sp.]
MDLDVDIDADADINYTADMTESHSLTTTESHNLETNQVASNIVRNETGNTDIRSERDEHGVSVNIDKSLSLNSDISFSGAPTLSGDIEIDSAAIALIDNRQSNTGNMAANELVTNDASIADDTGSEASGNLQFNVAAGDNNVQDNAAALSAADASFAFGLADAEIFVNQYGAGNATMNSGVTNSATMGGNAFSDASGNIGVNVASGNNNQQKNALAASVATSAYAQASVSSNQISTGNSVSNTGYVEEYTDSVDVALSGSVSGVSTGIGIGGYEGTSEGSYAGGGNSYQSSNFYADMWEGEEHPTGPVMGHADFDNESQGAVQNPNRDGVGGLGFDNEESGTYGGSESGDLAFLELSFSDLQASLAGSVATTQWVNVDHTNTANLSGSAFARASGNIGVNLAAGSGNLQANSLSMAVAQPSTGGTPPGNGGGE